MTSKERALEILNDAKQFLNTVYAAGGRFMKDKAGKFLLFMQDTSISAAIDTASGDTLDEQIVGLAGDALQGAILKPAEVVSLGAVAYFEVGLYATNNNLGGHLKKYYKLAKQFAQQHAQEHFSYAYVNSSWRYENKSGDIFQYLSNGEYAKVLLYDGKIFRQNDDTPVITKVTKSEYDAYNEYVELKSDIYAEIQEYMKQANTKIELKNGTLHVTMPNGVVYTQPYGDEVTTIATGGNKDDTLYGGSSSADTLNGKEGYDIYYADNQDTIYDSDGKGR
ncbi:hypothetical protein F1B92_08615, partial [Campylobacter sp. FMV-PI01]|nr:hypothetical protein [Campylobacter portucalensis]